MYIFSSEKRTRKMLYVRLKKILKLKIRVHTDDKGNRVSIWKDG